MSEPQKDKSDKAAALAEVVAKLKDYFPPELVHWRVKPDNVLLGAKPGQMITHVAFTSVQAVRDRLDSALGVNNWSESYDNPGTYTRCVLRVRFAADDDWVTRVGVSGAPDLDRGTAESLREAALSLGVGRYLSLYPQHVEWDGTHLKGAPRLPDHALPPEYRRAGREAAWKARQLILTACDESTKRGRDFSQLKRQVASALAYRHGGYRPAREGDDVDLSRMQVRHLAALTRQVNDWIAELAANQTDGPACVLARAADGNGKEENQKTAAAQTPAAQG